MDQNVLWRISDQYNRVSQQSSETVDAFYKRFKFLARVRNYHSRPSKHTEMMGATDFQDGLYNQQMKDNVSRQEPRTVLQAYMAAKKEERMSYMHKPPQQSRPPPSKQVASAAQSLPSASAPPTQNVAHRNGPQNNAFQGPPNGNLSWRNNADRPGPGGAGRWCEYCKDPRHGPYNCWFNPNSPNFRPELGPRGNANSSRPSAGNPPPGFQHTHTRAEQGSSDGHNPPSVPQDQGNLNGASDG